jgi:hypothetical protein
MQCPRCQREMRRISITPQDDKYRCIWCRHVHINPHPVPDPDVRFLCHDHQGKASAYLAALGEGFQRVMEAREITSGFMLSDSDVMGRGLQFKALYKRGVSKFFIYPHSGRPSLINDIWPASEYTTAQFVASPGHVEVIRLYGYEKPLHAVGWHLCPIVPYAPRVERLGGVSPLKILFAPIHPRCAPIDQQVNRAVFDRLIPLARDRQIALTVRFISSLHDSGLPSDYLPGIRYVRGLQDATFQDIDQADLVIGHQTFGSLAVARGRPTLMMGEDIPNHSRGWNGGLYRDVHSWNNYRDLIMFPLDILAHEDTMALIERAISTDEDIIAWRERMIGDPFDPDLFRSILKSYL